MSGGPWATVWSIAARRDATKQGTNHLTGHAHEVLQAFVVTEAQDAMANALGGFWQNVFTT